MTENIVTVALIAIATIGIVTLYGDNVRALFGASADTLAGDETGNRGAASSAGMTDKDLKTFGQQGGIGNGGNQGLDPN